MVPTVALYNLGCKVNQAEGDYLVRGLTERGVCSDAVEVADLIIVTTCTVTNDAETKTRKAIRRLLGLNSRAIVLAVGCAVAINPDYYLAIDSRVHVAASADLALETACAILELDGDDRLASPAKTATPAVPSTPATLASPATSAKTAPTSRNGTTTHQRINLKVQDGCNCHCTFCIVRIARGKSHSKPLPEILELATGYEQKGFREIVITAVNLGSYRLGEGSSETSNDLLQLLESLLASTSHSRFRLSSIEPLDITPELVDLIALSQGRICAHLHAPLQSGSDEVLFAMQRLYDTATYARRIAYAREKLPHLALSTDVIVGFPGESDDDFIRTMNFVREMQFMRLHVFRYSARQGTLAAEMPGQISAEIKARRSEELRQLADQLTIQDIKSRIGTTEMVLVEKPGLGRSESYHAVSLPENFQQGSLIEVRFNGHAGKLLEC